MLDVFLDSEGMQQRFQTLRPGRKLIVATFYQLRQTCRGSHNRVIPLVARELGYTLDRNGSNSYLLKVLREFFRS